ncbi:MAG: hypothetical protein CMM25_04785 [Rhodospirillaceae bacterium]|nr:hypothetical protein [Rhodospirillaceae bacterium]
MLSFLFPPQSVYLKKIYLLFTIPPILELEPFAPVWEEEREDWFPNVNTYMEFDTYTEAEFALRTMPDVIKEYKIESRFIYKGHPYRKFINFKNDKLEKVYIDPSVTKTHTFSAFVGETTNGPWDDITPRFEKYCGPEQNFFGSPIQPQDLFPFSLQKIIEKSPFLKLKNDGKSEVYDIRIKSLIHLS